jgi:effector-binding domain-containing protein
MDKKLTLMMIRHNTPYKTYRRAGIIFYQDSAPYEVTEEQLEILRNDPRIVMHEVKTLKK